MPFCFHSISFAIDVTVVNVHMNISYYVRSMQMVYKADKRGLKGIRVI